MGLRELARSVCEETQAPRGALCSPPPVKQSAPGGSQVTDQLPAQTRNSDPSQGCLCCLDDHSVAPISAFRPVGLQTGGVRTPLSAQEGLCSPSSQGEGHTQSGCRDDSDLHREEDALLPLSEENTKQHVLAAAIYFLKCVSGYNRRCLMGGISC